MVKGFHHVPVEEKDIQKSKKALKSRAGARKIKKQKAKGKRKGAGSRKGKINSRISKKERWIIKIRAQRKLLKELREKKEIPKEAYSDLYMKAKGGFFRSRRHIMIYLEERGLKKKK